MTDAPEDVRRAAGAIAAVAGTMSTQDAIEAGIVAERERIAIWHEHRAQELEEAIEKIIKEGGTVEISRRSMVDIHRSFAAAIRRGEVL